MSDRPFRLGPDQNRTYIERWNEMHPNRYGRPDSPAETEYERRRWSSDDAGEAGTAASPGGFLESLLGLDHLHPFPGHRPTRDAATLPVDAPGQPDTWMDSQLRSCIHGRHVRRRCACLRATPSAAHPCSSSLDAQHRIHRLASVDRLSIH